MSQVHSFARRQALVLTCSALVAPLSAATAQSYAVQELPPLAGHSFCAGWGINDSDVAVGQSGAADGVTVAVRWVNGVPQSLGTLPGFTASVAFDVSADGERVTGLCYVPNQGNFPLGIGVPFIWESGVMAPLPIPAGRNRGEPSQINDDGTTIVGTAYTYNPGSPTGNDAAVRWDRDASSGQWTVTVLPTLGGEGLAYAVDINADGSTFGYSSTELGEYRACRWDAANQPTDLGAGDHTFVSGGNDRGECVGTTANTTALLWLPQPAYGWPAGANDLGTPPGYARTWLNYINNSGVATGVAWNTGNPFEPAIQSRGLILWNGDLHMADALIPQQPTWTIRKLWDINETGNAVGLGLRSGLLRAIVLRVCPGDIDHNGRCDLADLSTLLAHFGSGDAAYADGDLDSDQEINLTDLASLLANFGSICQ